MSKSKILLMILVFFVITFGSFIWMIATWDKSKEEAIGFALPTSFILEGAAT